MAAPTNTGEVKIPQEYNEFKHITVSNLGIDLQDAFIYLNENDNNILYVVSERFTDKVYGIDGGVEALMEIFEMDDGGDCKECELYKDPELAHARGCARWPDQQSDGGAEDSD